MSAFLLTVPLTPKAKKPELHVHSFLYYSNAEGRSLQLSHKLV